MSEIEKNFLCLEIAEIDMGGFLGKKPILDIKLSSLKLRPFLGGKYPKLMTISLLQTEICDVISPKLVKATRPKLCIRHAFMAVMTHVKFCSNKLMVTLIFGVRASEPPSPGLAND